LLRPPPAPEPLPELPPAEPLLALPEPAPEPDPGPEPLPAAPLEPLVPPFWPCVSFVTAAPVVLLFFFDLLCVVEGALLSAEPAADASLLAVCIADEWCDELPLVPLMLDEDLLDFDLPDLLEPLLELVSLGIEVLPPDELVLLLVELGLLVLDPVPPVLPTAPEDASPWRRLDASELPVEPLVEEPLPMLEALPLEP